MAGSFLIWKSTRPHRMSLCDWLTNGYNSSHPITWYVFVVTVITPSEMTGKLEKLTMKCHTPKSTTDQFQTPAFMHRSYLIQIKSKFEFTANIPPSLHCDILFNFRILQVHMWAIRKQDLRSRNDIVQCKYLMCTSIISSMLFDLI